jgi:hypothetical protein
VADVERSKAERERGEAMTAGKAVGEEMPFEPKNSGAIAMAPQFLASHPPSPSLRKGSWVVAAGVAPKAALLRKAPIVVAVEKGTLSAVSQRAGCDNSALNRLWQFSNRRRGGMWSEFYSTFPG